MTRAKPLCTVLVAVLGAAQLAACATSASDTGRSSARASGVLDEAALTAKVTTALTAAGVAKPLSVHVTTRLGTVQLSGFVDSPEQARRAEEIARNVDGVKQVYNDIRVVPRG